MNDVDFQDAVEALISGDFSRLSSMLGGPDGFDSRIIEWHKSGAFNDEPDALAEAFACACFLGSQDVAEYLLDSGVDPVAGKLSGQTGFHYAVMGAHLDMVKLLIERKVPMEIENMYGGTVLGQAFWCAVKEHQASHADIIEALIDAGAHVGKGTLSWWQLQKVPSETTKERITAILMRNGVE